MAPLSWRHHTLLQALLSRGPLPESDFHAIFTAISGKNPGTPHLVFLFFFSPLTSGVPFVPFSTFVIPPPTAGHQVFDEMLLWRRGTDIYLFIVSWFAAAHQQLFNDTLLKINKDLAYLQLELRACINQYDGTVYYGLVNNIADEESKLGTKYSVPQIAFYKGLVYDCLILLELFDLCVLHSLSYIK
jgi:hypothetical protein